MGLDTFISVAIYFLAVASGLLGVIMTLHNPTTRKQKAVYISLFVSAGILSVLLVWWQGERNGSASDVAATKIQTLNDQVSKLQTDLEAVRNEFTVESARRKQAEQGLISIVQSTGASTRTGVAEDIRRSPIRVEVPGDNRQQQLSVTTHMVQWALVPNKNLTEVLIIPNQPVVGPKRFIVIADSNIISAETHVWGSGSIMLNADEEGPIYHFQITSPTPTPTNPIRVLLFGEGPITRVGVSVR